MSKDVHTEHCCVMHGCKYGNWSCVVVNGQKKQSFTCEYCWDEFSDLWDAAQLMNEMYDKGRQSVITVILPRVEGLPDHPWIPGVNFADGEILRVLS